MCSPIHETYIGYLSYSQVFLVILIHFEMWIAAVNPNSHLKVNQNLIVFNTQRHYLKSNLRETCLGALQSEKKFQTSKQKFE